MPSIQQVVLHTLELVVNRYGLFEARNLSTGKEVVFMLYPGAMNKNGTRMPSKVVRWYYDEPWFKPAKAVVDAALGVAIDGEGPVVKGKKRTGQIVNL